jgi:hypothetical protein
MEIEGWACFVKNQKPYAGLVHIVMHHVCTRFNTQIIMWFVKDFEGYHILAVAQNTGKVFGKMLNRRFKIAEWFAGTLWCKHLLSNKWKK